MSQGAAIFHYWIRLCLLGASLIFGLMKLKDITEALEAWAPPQWQEEYDNSGLLIGEWEQEIERALVCLDLTEDVLQEAQEKSCQLIISHHPLIFGGLKRLNGSNAVERMVMRALREGIAIYALHTNLDNVISGVNQRIGAILGIAKPRILAPKVGLLQKLVVYVPIAQANQVREAIFAAGAGAIGDYDQCSFGSEGEGSFRPGAQSSPFLGQRGERHYERELRLEFLVESHQSDRVISALRQAHPYEEVAYDLAPLANRHQWVGAGMYGDLAAPIATEHLLKTIKQEFGGLLRYTDPPKEKVQRLAWCGGSGSFLLKQARAVRADVFLSSDFKYHQFFEAEKALLLIDIGHYENEQFTIPLIADYLREKFPSFAVLLTEQNTNPINYL